MAPQILIVEDSLPLAAMWTQFLADEGVSLRYASTGGAAQEALDRGAAPAAILLDLGLPDMNGIDILRRVRERGLGSRVVVVTGNDSIDSAVAAMRLGAANYLTKPVSRDRLKITLREVLAGWRGGGHRTTERSENGCHGFIGRSLAMGAVYRLIEQAARSRANVLITGQSGTGKELCGAAIHALGPRAGGPFVAVNCGAIPTELAESEIFGHRRGAFTGAVADRPGAARLADKGVLFLDEICELPLSLQASLLRFVETGCVQPVGANCAEKVDLRIVAATNRDPLAEVAAGRFRADLYYRLNVLGIDMPPLSARDDDVLLIARSALDEFAREEGKSFTHFSPAVEAAFRRYGWPGNVRELRNLVRSVVVFHDGVEVDCVMLPTEWLRAVPATGKSREKEPPAASGLAMVERRAIEAAIRRFDGDVRAAAQELGVSPATIYRRRSRWLADQNRAESAASPDAP